MVLIFWVLWTPPVNKNARGLGFEVPREEPLAKPLLLVDALKQREPREQTRHVVRPAKKRSVKGFGNLAQHRAVVKTKALADSAAAAVRCLQLVLRPAGQHSPT